MKKLFLSIITLSCSVLFLHAQDTNLEALSLIAQTEANSIKLRWMMSDPKVWAEGNAVGYKIVRYTTHINGNRQDVVDVQASETVLATFMIPKSESYWESNFSGNDFAAVAKGALYSEDESVVETDNPTLADAFNNAESIDTRFLFGLFAAEQDFEVAKAMALGIEDTNFETGATYIYLVSLLSDDPLFANIKTAISVEASHVVNLPAPANVMGYGEDKSVMFQWSLKGLDTYYGSYDIERSADGVSFEKINEVPFVFAVEGEDDPGVASFKDRLDDNGTTYHYRVRGRTPFGTQGPPSASIPLKGTPPRLVFLLALSDCVEEEDAIRVTWDEVEATILSQLVGFNIYRSSEANKNYEQINTDLIPISAIDYLDPNPIPTAYYLIEAVDGNGHIYQSAPRLIQQNDMTPPAIPTGLSGEFVTSSKVVLTWDENTEEDFKGYRLFVANKETSTYTQITSDAIRETHYSYEIDPTFEVENIFFSILSTDNRDNYSEKSAPISIQRPDIIPPSKPILYKVVPALSGIEFGFKFSSSKDRVSHELQLKPENQPGWVTIIDVNVSEESDYQTNLTPDQITATNLIVPNNRFTKRQSYQFRLLARDDAGNTSSSSIMTATPYDSGKMGEIENFELVQFTISGGDSEAALALHKAINFYQVNGEIGMDRINLLLLYNGINQEQYNEIVAHYNGNPNDDAHVYAYLLEIAAQNELELGSSAKPRTRLSWQYSSTDNLRDFQVFRSAEGSAMMLYKTLPIESPAADGQYEYEDKDLKPGARYFYQVMARHAGEGFSPLSEVRMVKIAN